MTDETPVSDFESELLQRILESTEAVKRLKKNWSFDMPIGQKMAISDLDRGWGVRLESWGGSDAAAQKRRNRALHALEERGLIALAGPGTRSTHAALTATGRRRAESLAGPVNAIPAKTKRSRKAAK
jgi:hypothetical protein